eukprot:TRINITY_DN11080_c0_g1_i1.p1 TRINITY_DN11080_c0_g1~~TRINITY_DN11080_c0_g1_i1.p1  ORF type:complete len:435 (+),score=83.57 TRINITY_DN11080_c0_g1_i1:319-1623(+)
MLTLCAVVVISMLPVTSKGSMGDDFEPQFVGLVQNVTVVVGREAILSCSVTKLRDFKVGWIKADQTILTLHKRVITHNDRIHITHDMHNTWDLHIKDVIEADQDCYMCQINTEQMKKQVGCVSVLVPPDIDQSVTSGDLTVTEGGNVTLNCVAKGQPKPQVTWKREDKEDIKIMTHSGIKKGVGEWKGQALNLMNVRRDQMGAFFCIAKNDVPPAVSRRIVLNVHFKPKVWVDNQLVGAPLGDDVQIECLIEAFPRSITYWQKTSEAEGRDIILMNGSSHVVEEIRIGYKTVSRLKITNFSSGDAGTYQCLSTNSLGTDHDVIRIYENPQVTEPPWKITKKTTQQQRWKNRGLIKSTTASFERFSQRVDYRNTYRTYDNTQSKQLNQYSGYGTTERNADGRKYIFSAALDLHSPTQTCLFLCAWVVAATSIIRG